MSDAGVGRLLVASLHQAVADLLPARLEFYESWLNPTGLRDGRIGLASLAAVLSFLRQEGESYRLVAARAGEYTADWTVADLPPLQRALIRAAPAPIRTRLAMRVARRLVRSTFAGSHPSVHVKRGEGAIDIRHSIFCQVRERSERPLCDYYVSATRRLMQLFSLDVEVVASRCRAAGGTQCVVSVFTRRSAVRS